MGASGGNKPSISEDSIIPVYLRQSIKSSYILKQIFSYLTKKKKLSIIAHNTKYQKLFEINKEDYKRISGKIIYFDKKGNGKIYKADTNQLLFEGRYLNGKKNGKGKEFDDNNNVVFEGEYLEGKKWNGIIKTYYDNQRIKFEGTYKAGEINGLCREYNNDGILEFEGNYLCGERNGQGKEYFFNGNLRYKCSYSNGKRHGHGKIYHWITGKLLYKGEFYNGEQVKCKK